MPRPSKLIVSTVSRSAAARGPTSSSAWNDTFEEIINDFVRMFKQWNETVVPLTATLPLDAFSLGLDGKTFYVDANASGSVAGTARYYNATKRRPNTLKEQIEDTYRGIDAAILKFQSELSTVTNGLTEAQRAAIGMRIFDASRASSATSLDGRTRLAELNVTQVAKDLYGSPPNLDGDGNPNLANSIRAMLTSLLALHNGTWDTDVTLSHDGVISSLPQTQVQSTLAFNDADPFSGGSANLQQDLNRIRTRIRSILGTASWSANITEPFVGSGATSLQGIVSLSGTVAKSPNNPWGYSWTDVGGLEARVLAANRFVGQNSPVDEFPVYSSVFYVKQNTNLEEAVSALDQALRDNSVGLSPALSGHKVGSVGVLPSGGCEHWDKDVCLVNYSGTSINYSGLHLDTAVHWMADPAHATVAGQQFRRLETVLTSGQQMVTINHNRNLYPIVQTIFFDSGMYYSITHASSDSFTFSGVEPVRGSGLIISLW